MKIAAWNPSTDELEKSYLTTSPAAAVSFLNVKNTDRIAANKILLVGNMGFEQSELVTTTTYTTDVTSRVNLVDPTKFAHTSDDPVYVMDFNQVMFYRSNTSDPEGAYTLISTQFIDVDNSEEKTFYEDLAGSASSYYKYKFYNTITSEESSYSDYIQATGSSRKEIGSAIKAAVSRVGDPGYTLLSPEDLLEIADEVSDDITSQSERPYNFLRKTTTANRVAGQAYIPLPDGWLKFSYLEYSNVQGGYPRVRRLFPISEDQFAGGYNAYAPSDYISRVVLDEENSRILLKPTPLTNATGAFKVVLYEDFDEFTDFSQEVKTPNTLIYKYKMIAELYSKKAEKDPSFGNLATKYEQKYGNELMKLQRSNRRDVGTPRSFADSLETSSYRQPDRRRFTL